MAMSTRNKHQLFHLGRIGLYAFLPYSLPCIAIGGAYYALFQRKQDHSGLHMTPLSPPLPSPPSRPTSPPWSSSAASTSNPYPNVS